MHRAEIGDASDARWKEEAGAAWDRQEASAAEWRQEHEQVSAARELEACAALRRGQELGAARTAVAQWEAEANEAQTSRSASALKFKEEIAARDARRESFETECREMANEATERHEVSEAKWREVVDVAHRSHNASARTWREEIASAREEHEADATKLVAAQASIATWEEEACAANASAAKWKEELEAFKAEFVARDEQLAAEFEELSAEVGQATCQGQAARGEANIGVKASVLPELDRDAIERELRTIDANVLRLQKELAEEREQYSQTRQDTLRWEKEAEQFHRTIGTLESRLGSETMHKREAEEQLRGSERHAAELEGLLRTAEEASPQLGKRKVTFGTNMAVAAAERQNQASGEVSTPPECTGREPNGADSGASTIPQIKDVGIRSPRSKLGHVGEGKPPRATSLLSRPPRAPRRPKG